MFLQTSPNCVQSRPGIPYGHIFKQMHSRYLWEVSAKRQQFSYPLSSCKDCRMRVFASAASHNMQEFSLPLYSCPCRNSRGAYSYCLHLEKTLLISYPTTNSKLYSHTHFSFCHLRALSKGSTAGRQGGTHTRVWQSRCGIFKRIFQEAITRGSNRGNKDNQM